MGISVHVPLKSSDAMISLYGGRKEKSTEFRALPLASWGALFYHKAMSCTCRYRKRIAAAGMPYVPERSVYLDYNATTPPDRETLAAFERSCRQGWANPGSLHTAGVAVHEAMEGARKSIAAYFLRKPEALFFCGSGTEAIHAGLSGWTAKNPEGTILTTRLEHSSVFHPLRIRSLSGKSVVFLPVDGEGTIDPEGLARELKSRGKSLLVYSPVNHETGGLQPVKDIFRASESADCTVFIDGVQAASRLSPAVWAPHCHLFAVSSHKLYAPKGTGFLCAGGETRRELRPFRFGGPQEEGLFPGTENLPGILALARAVELLSSRFSQDEAMLRALENDGRRILESSELEYVWESPPHKVGGVFCVSLPWVSDMEDLLFFLNGKHIFLSRFSACTGRVDGASRVLLAMGRPVHRASTSLRIALGRESLRKDIFALASALKEYRGKPGSRGREK